jgi:hypothetical protein
MRTMLKVVFPASAGNKVIKDGSLPKLVEAFVKKFKPEAAYFFPSNGKRTMLFVFEMPDATHIPSVAEPFFSGLEADLSLTPVMNLEDLKAGLKKAM